MNIDTEIQKRAKEKADEEMMRLRADVADMISKAHRDLLSKIEYPTWSNMWAQVRDGLIRLYVDEKVRRIVDAAN